MRKMILLTLAFVISIPVSLFAQDDIYQIKEKKVSKKSLYAEASGDVWSTNANDDWDVDSYNRRSSATTTAFNDSYATSYNTHKIVSVDDDKTIHQDTVIEIITLNAYEPYMWSKRIRRFHNIVFNVYVDPWYSPYSTAWGWYPWYDYSYPWYDPFYSPWSRPGFYGWWGGFHYAWNWWPGYYYDPFYHDPFYHHHHHHGYYAHHNGGHFHHQPLHNRTGRVQSHLNRPSVGGNMASRNRNRGFDVTRAGSNAGSNRSGITRRGSTRSGDSSVGSYTRPSGHQRGSVNSSSANSGYSRGAGSSNSSYSRRSSSSSGNSGYSGHSRGGSSSRSSSSSSGSYNSSRSSSSSSSHSSGSYSSGGGFSGGSSRGGGGFSGGGGSHSSGGGSRGGGGRR